eukprot:Seg599.12 transcript_id=Seg599.12/GoldUCD/mRNA.D3Y31 product="hypothetical protein" protein_id=Seg599.12/GoldUCD/D3Y31
MHEATTLLLCLVFLCGICHAQQHSTKACVDKLSTAYCKMLKKHGACRSSMSKMVGYCPKTCQFCDDDCFDYFRRLCPWWQRHYACKTHAHILNKYCRKSCGNCNHAKAPPKKAACSFTEYGCCWDMKTEVKLGRKCPQCKDRYYHLCRYFMTECFYGRNRAFMEKNCPKTCRKCTPDKLTVREL